METVKKKQKACYKVTSLKYLLLTYWISVTLYFIYYFTRTRILKIAATLELEFPMVCNLFITEVKLETVVWVLRLYTLGNFHKW